MTIHFWLLSLIIIIPKTCIYITHICIYIYTDVRNAKKCQRTMGSDLAMWYPWPPWPPSPKQRSEGSTRRALQRADGEGAWAKWDGFLPGIKICGSERPGKYLTNTANTWCFPLLFWRTSSRDMPVFSRPQSVAVHLYAHAKIDDLGIIPPVWLAASSIIVQGDSWQSSYSAFV